MLFLVELIAVVVVVHCTVTASAQTPTPRQTPPIPTTPRWKPPEQDWEFTVYDYPNSLTQPDRCSQTQVSYLCDPKSLLSTDDRNKITAKLNAHASLSVAIVHKIKVLDESQLNATMYTEANKILRNLVTANKSLDQEGSLLFVSAQDIRVVFVTPKTSSRCFELQHTNSTALFENGQLSLSEYVDHVTDAYISSKCAAPEGTSPVVIVLVVIFSIVLMVLIAVVVFLVMKRQNQKEGKHSPHEQVTLQQHPTTA